MVMAGIINTILSCGITFDKLLIMDVTFRWKELKNRSEHEVQWKDMGREMQRFLHEHQYKVILQWHTDDEGLRPIQVYHFQDEHMTKFVTDMLFAQNAAFVGAVTFINARSPWMSVTSKLKGQEITE